MKESIMVAKIHALIKGDTVKFSRGRNKFALMSERQESQLFNVLHREFNAHRMAIKRISDNELSIVSSTFEGDIILDSKIRTY